MKETWKDIKGYEGAYQISSFGNIRSFDRFVKSGIRNNPIVKRKGCLLKLQTNSLGYKHISLYKDGVCKNINIHKTVAETFIPDKTNFKYMPYENIKNIDIEKLVVNHKDENPSNNNVNNLEWCTQAYNINYGTRNKKLSKIMRNYEKFSKKINQYDLEGNFIKTWGSIKEIWRETGYTRSAISKCCRGIYKKSKGYIWKFYDEMKG